DVHRRRAKEDRDRGRADLHGAVRGREPERARDPAVGGRGGEGPLAQPGATVYEEPAPRHVGEDLDKWGAPKWPPKPPNARRAPANPLRATTPAARFAPAPPGPSPNPLDNPAAAYPAPAHPPTHPPR